MGTPITVQGFNFQNQRTLACSFNGFLFPGTYMNPNEIKCQVPVVRTEFQMQFQVQVTYDGQDFSNSINFTVLLG